MSDIDKDLQRRLKGFADQISQEPGRSAVVLRKARGKRRLVALGAGLAVLVTIGGLAGATTLLGDRGGITPGPGPEDLTACEQSTYDVAVFIQDVATESEIQALRQDLEEDSEVEALTFMSRKAAFEEFKEHYADQPEFWENLPEDALPMSFRVSLVDGADSDAAARRFKTLDHVEAVRTREDLSNEQGARDAAPGCPSTTFARYFFEAGSRDASANGVLEVNSQEGTLCYKATTENIRASHLLRNTGVVAGGRRFERTIVVTFFEPDDGQPGADLPSAAPICLQGEQLGELEGDLQMLIDHPEDFVVDFHRGPNDQPGLIAELVPPGVGEPCAMGAAITEITPASVAPGERVIFAGECFQDLRLHKKTKVFLTATVDEGGQSIAKEDLGTLRTCELIAEPRSKVRIFEGGELRGWLIVPQDGTCFGEQSARTHVPLGVGMYQVAVGCRACTYANLRVDPGATSSALAGVRALVRSFMQARLEGVGAEELLDAHGRREFGAGSDTTELYPDPAPKTFRIEFVDHVGGGGYEVGVSFIFEEGSYGETLFVREPDGRFTISGARPGLDGP